MNSCPQTGWKAINVRKNELPYQPTRLSAWKSVVILGIAVASGDVRGKVGGKDRGLLTYDIIIQRKHKDDCHHSDGQKIKFDLVYWGLTSIGTSGWSWSRSDFSRDISGGTVTKWACGSCLLAGFPIGSDLKVKDLNRMCSEWYKLMNDNGEGKKEIGNWQLPISPDTATRYPAHYVTKHVHYSMELIMSPDHLLLADTHDKVNFLWSKCSSLDF